MLQFLFLFLLMMITTSIFINGFYNITRGHWVTNPNGTKTWEGKIFKAYGKWLQSHTEKIVFYTSIEEGMKQLYSLGVDGLVDSIEIKFGKFYLKDIKFKELIEKKSLGKNIYFTYLETASGLLVSIYTFEKVYDIPFLVRYPLGECLSCMSSIFGLTGFLFWYRVSGLFDSIYPNKATSFLLQLPWYDITGLIAFFCFSLTWLNVFFYNLNDKLATR